jgi:hypothetical protein
MEADTQRVSAASAGLTSLALRLTKQLAANKSSEQGGNLVFSPLSIYAVLALVAICDYCRLRSRNCKGLLCSFPQEIAKSISSGMLVACWSGPFD